MIVLKSNKLAVRCLECKEKNLIEMNFIGSDEYVRSIGVESEHIYRGESKCKNCDDEMRLLVSIFEFPPGELNYIDVDNKSSILLDDIEIL